jgi:membrane protease YdiL (CAAX protease family)
MAERKEKEASLSKSYILIPFVFICAGVAAAALAPVLKQPVDAAYSWLSAKQKDVPVRRVFERCAMVFAVVLLIAFRKYMKSRVRASIDPKQNPPGKPFLGGLLIGVVALLCVAALMAILGGAPFINPHVEASAFWSAFGKALGIAIVVCFFEEILFRGIIFQGLRADLGTGLATVLGAAFFSLVHFMRPRKIPDIASSDPLGGFKILGHAFDRFGNFSEILPFAIGLFLIGILLTVAYLKTSALFLPMGLHASLIFFSKLDYTFLGSAKKASALLFGSPDPYPSFLKGVDALPTWVMIVVLTFVIGVFGNRLQSKGAKGESAG